MFFLPSFLLRASSFPPNLPPFLQIYDVNLKGKVTGCNRSSVCWFTLPMLAAARTLSRSVRWVTGAQVQCCLSRHAGKKLDPHKRAQTQIGTWIWKWTSEVWLSICTTTPFPKNDIFSVLILQLLPHSLLVLFALAKENFLTNVPQPLLNVSLSTVT